MNISEKILQLAKNQSISNKKIFEKLKISEGGFYDKIKKNFFNTNEIKKLSELFGVSEAYFFGGEELEMVQVKKIPIRAYAGVLSKGLDNIQILEY